MSGSWRFSVVDLWMLHLGKVDCLQMFPNNTFQNYDEMIFGDASDFHAQIIFLQFVNLN